jgi:hypothetical protein
VIPQAANVKQSVKVIQHGRITAVLTNVATDFGKKELGILHHSDFHCFIVFVVTLLTDRIIFFLIIEQLLQQRIEGFPISIILMYVAVSSNVSPM